MPVKSVIQLDLLAVALWKISIRMNACWVVWAAYKTKGMHARAIHPDLVPNGGEPPKSKLGQ